MINTKHFPGLWILKPSTPIWTRLWHIPTEARADGGFFPVLMFRILVIQTLNNLSDKRIKYLVNDRLSFMSFLGLGRSDQVPDAKTIWLFHERLKQTGAIERLFERLDATLRNASYLPACGQIRDATLVPPKQRNTNAEKADLREGNMPPSVIARN